MNDIKYVMLPRIDEKPKNVKQQPWYKERLKTKYLSNAKTTKGSTKERILDAKQWTFVKDGLDDFRDGLPPPHEDLLIKVRLFGAKNCLFDQQWLIGEIFPF